MKRLAFPIVLMVLGLVAHARAQCPGGTCPRPAYAVAPVHAAPAVALPPQAYHRPVPAVAYVVPRQGAYVPTRGYRTTMRPFRLFRFPRAR